MTVICDPTGNRRQLTNPPTAESGSCPDSLRLRLQSVFRFCLPGITDAQKKPT